MCISLLRSSLSLAALPTVIHMRLIFAFVCNFIICGAITAAMQNGHGDLSLKTDTNDICRALVSRPANVAMHVPLTL